MQNAKKDSDFEQAVEVNLVTLSEQDLALIGGGDGNAQPQRDGVWTA